MPPLPLRILVWNEFIHERQDGVARQNYPLGIHQTLTHIFAADPGLLPQGATLSDPDQGLNRNSLQSTDVLVWWSHCAQSQVDDTSVENVLERVNQGMGLLFLHASHGSKLFHKLVGRRGRLSWRDQGERETLWPCHPDHPIVQGVSFPIVLDQEEMYGEPFGVPEPDETVLMASFAGGEVFRAGMTWNRGPSRIFYFQPGHETFPSYHHPSVQSLLRNIVRWIAPLDKRSQENPS